MRKPGFIPSFNIVTSVKFVRDDVWKWIKIVGGVSVIAEESENDIWRVSVGDG